MAATPPIARIALTPGEPSGIGPDLCLMVAQQPQHCELVAFADPELLTERARQLDLPISLESFRPEQAAQASQASQLKVAPVALRKKAVPGRLDCDHAPYVLKTIRRATKACLDQQVSAMVTGPVHKGIINDAGIAFSGHTEFIADITGGHPVMMLTAPGLRVALVTTHLPLAEVSAAITRHRLRTVLQVLHKDLMRRFAIERPTILVCGLNPHAGENGHLGREEIDIIEPVLNHQRQQGMHLIGPLPADTLFTSQYLDSADAVLAMYHDQGLPVLKHIGFGQAVNITLGLPIVRTSVDHGTALTLAATGTAECSSLQAAIDQALAMIHN